MPRPRRVVVGVTGSIAAYKAAEVVRLLVKSGCEVRCVLTPNGAQFVTPLTLAALSRNPVAQNLHDPSLWKMAHLDLASWADLVLVVPATVDFIARLAQGRAEGVLDALILSTKAKVAVCPACDAEMWEHRATQDNVKRIKDLGYEVWGPEKGELASGKTGWGRLREPEDVVRQALGKA